VRHVDGPYKAIQVQQSQLAQIDDGVGVPSGETAIRAARTCARHARDAEDLRLLLDMLGLRVKL
jgi:hypothetical protein